MTTLIILEKKNQQDGDKYQITVILQHDKQLIMPGDGAFALECDMKSQDNRTLKLYVNRF